ncbi:MAG: FtsK/SpoIIIE domain-containing protein, partial [Nocardioides sp.]
REPGWALLRTGVEAPARFRVDPAPAPFTAEALRRIADAGAHRARPICLPPLTASPPLRQLLDPDHATAGGTTRADPARRCSPAGESVGSHALPIGLVDDPVVRRVAAIDADRGHVAVVGRPGSGKSTLLATIEEAARTVRPGMRTVRLDARASDLPDLPPTLPVTLPVTLPATAGTLLIVDDWSVLRQERPLVEDALVRLALARPDVRMVIAAHRWGDVRPALHDLLETRIELRLADPLDSLLDRRLAAAVPVGRPGWGQLDGELFLAAVPGTVRAPGPSTSP